MDERILTSIERRILQDCKSITAKFLAIQHKIHIGKARSHMEAFLQQQEKNKDSVPYALYSVIGEVRGGIEMDTNSQKTEDSMDLDGVNHSMQGSQQAVYLSDFEHLDETKKLFTRSPKVCLYALSPPLSSSSTKVQKLAAISQLPNIQHELKNTVEYVKGWSESGYGAKIGGIAPAKDIIRSEQNKASSSGIVPIKQDAKSDSKSAVKPNDTKSSKAESSSKLNFGSNEKSSKKEKEESDKKSAIKKADTSKAKKGDEEEEEEEEDTPIGYVGESQMATDVPVDQGGAERKRADASDKPVNAQEEKRRRQKQELMDMMDEDKDGNADPDVPIGDSTATSMMGGEEKKEKSSKKDKAEPGKTKKRVQKERKVIRQERYKDERGYRATRDVEETELYTTDESSEEDENSIKRFAPKKTSAKDTAETKKKTEADNSKKEQEQPSATAAPSNRNVPDSAPSALAPKKTANKAAGGQSKLSSFFTKKK